MPARGEPFPRSIKIQLNGRLSGVSAINGAEINAGATNVTRKNAGTKGTEEWVHYQVTSRSGDIELAVNGEVVFSGTNAKPRKGYIGIGSEGSEVNVRNMRIRELPSSKPGPEFIICHWSIQIKFTGSVLFK